MKTLLLSALFILTSISKATDLPQVPFLVTSGEAEINIKPTEVTINFDLITFAPSSEKSFKIFTQRSLELKKIFKEFKIDRKDIEAEELDKDIVREDNKDYEKSKILGYEFSRDYNVKIRDLSTYAAFITKLFIQDNIDILSTSFTNNREEEYKEELMLQAMKNAKTKAKQLAKIAESEVLGVYAISDVTIANLGTRFLLSGVNFIEVDCIPFGEEHSLNLEDTVEIPSKIKMKAKIETIFKLK